MMADELQKNVPDYLMNTNSSLITKEELKSANEALNEFSLNKSIKNNENMPRIIKD